MENRVVIAWEEAQPQYEEEMAVLCLCFVENQI